MSRLALAAGECRENRGKHPRASASRLAPRGSVLPLHLCQRFYSAAVRWRRVDLVLLLRLESPFAPRKLRFFRGAKDDTD